MLSFDTDRVEGVYDHDFNQWTGGRKGDAYERQGTLSVLSLRLGCICST